MHTMQTELRTAQTADHSERGFGLYVLGLALVKLSVFGSLAFLAMFGQALAFDTKVNLLGTISVAGIIAVVLWTFWCFPWRKALLGLVSTQATRRREYINLLVLTDIR